MFDPLSDVEHPDVLTGPIKIHVVEQSTGFDLGYTNLYLSGTGGLDTIYRLLAGFKITIAFPRNEEPPE